MLYQRTKYILLQDEDERVIKVIKDYQERLKERTRHHMG